MAAPNLTAENFSAAFKALLPRGRAWPKEEGTTQAKIINGFAAGYARATARQNRLLVDAFPATAGELLPDWEATLALPDPDLPTISTLQGRRGMVVAKLTGLGGQSASYYKRYAARLGYTITVQNYEPFKCGRGRCGQPLNGKDWAHVWSVASKLNTVTRFKAGQSCAGEPLATWNDEILEKALKKVQPAHAILLFHYVSEE